MKLLARIFQGFSLATRGYTNASQTQRHESSLHDLENGFFIQDSHFLWGVTLEEVAARGHFLSDSGSPRRRDCGPGRYFGLDIAKMSVGAHSPSRPITQASYEIAKPEGVTHLEFIRKCHSDLIEHIGRPDSGDINLSKLEEGCSGAVIAYAAWRMGGVSLGVSWFGAARVENSMLTSGALYADWDDEIAVALPFVNEWKLRQAVLDSVKLIQPLSCIDMDEQQVQRMEHYHFDAKPGEPSKTVLRAQRALYWPDLLFTPKHFLGSNLPDANRLLAWESEAAACWGISNVFDTVMFEKNGRAPISWDRVRPAKGPGGHYLSVGSLFTSRAYGGDHFPDDIVSFLDRLKTIPGVELDIFESSDC